MESTPITEIIKSTGIPAAVDSVRELLEKLVGPAAGEVGELLADGVRSHRFKNQVSILVRSQEILIQAGLSPRAVPLRTLVPMLDAASLEDDPDLSDMWATLIAAAASRPDSDPVPPAFPEIMRQLSPLDARLFNQGFQRWGLPIPPEESAVHWNKLPREAELPGKAITLNNLERLGLVEVDSGVGRDLDTIEREIGKVYQHLADPYSGSTQRPHFWHRRNAKDAGTVVLTALGFAFLRACLPPLVPPLSSPDLDGMSDDDLRDWESITGASVKYVTNEPELAGAFRSTSLQAGEKLRARYEARRAVAKAEKANDA